MLMGRSLKSDLDGQQELRKGERWEWHGMLRGAVRSLLSAEKVRWIFPPLSEHSPER